MRSHALLALLLVGGACHDRVNREVGARCDVQSDCDDRCLGPGPDYPQGFCSIDCSVNADCPDETVCADREGGVCLFGCVDNADCNFLGQGWSCHDSDLKEGGKAGVCRGD